MDVESLDRWDDYTKAKEAMLLTTDTDYARWTSIKSNDKKRARINAIRYFLHQFDYEARIQRSSTPLISCWSSEDATPSTRGSCTGRASSIPETWLTTCP
jgi:hypothetical protein